MGRHARAPFFLALAASAEPLLRNVPLLMTHDAATGYVGSMDIRAKFLKTQQVGLGSQLDCGVRAFDIRLIEIDGKAKFHHLSGTGVPASSGVLNQDLAGPLGLPVFTAWGDRNPDDLVILYISHCFKASGTAKITEGKDCYSAEKGTPAAFFADIARKHNVWILNDDSPDGSVLNTLTLSQAKEKAKLAGQPAVMAVFTPPGIVTENFDPDVKWGGFLSHEGEWEKMKTYLHDTVSTGGASNRFWMTQAFWQGSPVPSTKDLNEKLVSDAPQSSRYGQMSSGQPVWTAVAEGRMNWLEINFVCYHGMELAEKLGTKVSDEDKDKCNAACGRGVRGMEAVWAFEAQMEAQRGRNSDVQLSELMSALTNGTQLDRDSPLDVLS